MSYVLTDARYDRVLAFINKLRAEHKIGKPLKRIPRGDVSSFHKCPIATALIGGKVEAAGVDDSSITLWTYNYLTLKNKVDVQTPNYVSAFINAFDEGACTRLRKLAKANV